MMRIADNWLNYVLCAGTLTIHPEMDFMTVIHLDETMDLLQEIMVRFVKNKLHSCVIAIHRSCLSYISLNWL